MKKSAWLMLIFLVLVLNSARSQEEQRLPYKNRSQEEYRQLYKNKVHTYIRMTRTGLLMTGIGGGSLLAGSILLGTLPAEYWNANYGYVNPNQEKYDRQAIQGMIFFSLGVGLLAGGITLSSIGSHKVKSYRHKLDNLSLGVIYAPERQGLSLTYHF